MTQGGFLSGSDMDRAEMARLMDDCLSPRDRAMGFLPQTLLDQQLAAIKRVIGDHAKAREAEAYQFEVLDTDPR